MHTVSPSCYGHAIDPLQLTSSFREYGRVHQHGSVFEDSSFYGDLGKRSDVPTVLLACVESNEM